MNLNKLLLIAVGATLIVLAGLYIRTQSLEKASTNPSLTPEASPAHKFYTKIEACAMTKENSPLVTSVNQTGKTVIAEFAGILHGISPVADSLRLAVTSLDLQETDFFLVDSTTPIFDETSSKSAQLEDLTVGAKLELSATCTYNKENTMKVTRITITTK